MIRSYVVRFRALSIFGAAVAILALASCAEDIGGGGACPLLCPQESAPLKDTILNAITLDTSVAAFPELGFESNLTLAKRGDTLDTRVIVRFDSLPTTYKFGADDSTIVRIDSAFVRAIVPASDTALKFKSVGALEVYDVTDAANDTLTSSLAAQFTPANRIGSLAYAVDGSPDTITVQIDTARVRRRIQNGQSLRVGFRLVTTGSDQIRFISQSAGEGPTLNLYPKRNAETIIIRSVAKSLTPADPVFLRGPLADFTIAVTGGVPSANVLRVGGFPGRRVLLRFNIPSRIVDSSVVIRATLFLTQKPATTAEAGDPATVHIVPILASSLITDIHQLLEFAASAVSFPVDSLTVIPKDSARRELQVVTLVRSWKGQDTIKTPRLAALYLSSETTRTAGIEFFSTEAPIGVRPQLRITFVTRVSTGRP